MIYKTLSCLNDLIAQELSQQLRLLEKNSWWKNNEGYESIKLSRRRVTEYHNLIEQLNEFTYTEA